LQVLLGFIHSIFSNLAWYLFLLIFHLPRKKQKPVIIRRDGAAFFITLF